MKLIGHLLVASAVALGACAAGDKTADTTDTAAAAAPAAATQTPAPDATPATPATGTTHEVRMLGGDDKGYRYEPASITIKAGDVVKWVMVSGGPHNVAFDPAQLADDVEQKLSAAMPNQQQPLSSPFFMNPGESYIVSFAGIKPGTYNYVCTPHLAMNMKGTVTVQ